jgi:DNA-binding transcriptional LysR family regulator
MTIDTGLGTSKGKMDWAERVGRRIKLRDLHVFMTVAEAGSMAKAAEILAVSQPVVSKVIADVEHALGVRLFDRDRHGAEATAYGHMLLQRAQVAVDELRQGVNDIQFLRTRSVGELRIAAANPIAAELIPAIIDRLSVQHPGIVYHVTAGMSLLEQHIRALHARQLDLILGWLPENINDRTLDVELLLEEPTLIVAGLRSKWIKRRRIQLHELIDEHWVLPAPDTFVGGVVADLFEKKGLPLPKKRVFCNAIQLSNGLLATGRYLGFYPRSVLRLGADRVPVRNLNIDLAIRSNPLGVITLKGRMLSPIGRLFLDCARQVASKLSK